MGGSLITFPKKMNIPENHLVSPPNAGIGKYFRLLQSMNVELDNTACWNPWKASSGIQYGSNFGIDWDVVAYYWTEHVRKECIPVLSRRRNISVISKQPTRTSQGNPSNGR